MNILFIGFGPHSKRIQFPYVMRNSEHLDLEEVAILDLITCKKTIEEELENITPPQKVMLTSYYTDLYIDEELLDRILATHHITHVVLGTDPEHHFKYIEYLIQKSLKVIMDKPIVTVPNSISDKFSAMQIINQFKSLNEMYMLNPTANVTVLSQRRYHPAYNLIQRDLIANYKRVGIAPHYIYLLHSDGQFRFLEEIDSISYHGYNRGYGKISHSGYHFIDTLYLYLKPFIKLHVIDNFVISAHHLKPFDYSLQVDNRSIENIFMQPAKAFKASSGGEIDAYITIQFKKGNQLVTTARIDMLHSGFSDRVHFDTNTKDLYKGNGRIRHEKQIILQGPIYAAYIDSLQSKQINLNDNNTDAMSLGGEHHFELIRFNHSSSGKKVVSTKKISDLMNITDYGQSRGHQEEARYYALDDFFNSSLAGKRSVISDLSDHYFSSLIMSSAYLALESEQPIKGKI